MYLIVINLIYLNFNMRTVKDVKRYEVVTTECILKSIVGFSADEVQLLLEADGFKVISVLEV